MSDVGVLGAESFRKITSEVVSTFAGFVPADFGELVALRIAEIRESLEREGRFDPKRARERLRTSFLPEETNAEVLAGERVGFSTVRPVSDGFQRDHL